MYRRRIQFYFLLTKDSPLDSLHRSLSTQRKIKGGRKKILPNCLHSRMKWGTVISYVVERRIVKRYYVRRQWNVSDASTGCLTRVHNPPEKSDQCGTFCLISLCLVYQSIGK